MKVSIVIPVHNDQKYTKQCVDSIRRSTSPGEYELIIVDNGSDQATKDFLKSLKVKVITNDQNEGFAKAVNKGIRKSSAPYVFVLNNDTAVFPGWLSRMLAAFDDHTGAVGPVSNYVMGKQRVIVGRKEAKAEQIHKLVTLQGAGKTTETDLLIGFAVMVSRKAIDRVGFFDERFFAGSEDLDYSLRLRRAGFKLKIVEDVFVFHVGSQTSREILHRSDEFFRQANAVFFEKWSKELGVSVTSHRQAFEVALNLPGPPLTICTIHKNECGYLENMVKKANAFCDDYVIVDTGSSDDSVDRLRTLLLNNGCVIESEWNDSFSFARNVGLNQCRGEWVLQLDADEVIDKRYTKLMRQMLEHKEVDAFRFRIINFRESPFLVANPKRDIFTSVRMWRNRDEVQYEGLIHETVTESLKRCKYRIAEAPVPIWHFAYLKPEGRHFDLMVKAAREEPRRSNTHYFLGEEYVRRGNLQKALSCFTNALACNMSKTNDESFSSPVQQMSELVKAVLEGKEITDFPENVRQRYAYLVGR